MNAGPVIPFTLIRRYYRGITMKRDIFFISLLVFTPFVCLAADPVSPRVVSPQRPVDSATRQEEKKPAAPAQNGSIAPGEPVAQVDPETALRRLVDGNRRFISNREAHPNESAQRRIMLGLTGQHPYAIVLSCSDSRVPPEMVFDVGLGDLFVVRVAGHVVDDAVIGSIEYASEHLGSKLLVVLGHEKCGAVQAAINNQRDAHLRYLVDAIQPTVAKVKARTPPTDSRGLSDLVVWANVIESMNLLESSEPVLAKMVREKRLKIAGGVYHIETGRVQLLQ